MNKLFTTLLAIMAIAAFSTQAQAATINDNLVINITVQIDHNLEIVWTNNADGTAAAPHGGILARNWQLGSSGQGDQASVALAGTYDTDNHDSVDLSISNLTTVVPIQYDIFVNDTASNWTHVEAKVPANDDEFLMFYRFGAGAFNLIDPDLDNDGTPDPSTIALNIAPNTGTPVESDLSLQIEIPTTITRGNSGTIVATVYAIVY